jgi:hypothetical protein
VVVGVDAPERPAVEEALDRIDGRLALGLPDALASGFLGLVVNVLRFRKIELVE